ncbi:hypothetical protein [Luteococcus peritonei]|uniref:Uncharacterized protein n=1 Tax=Luteococcus peritonei TaxID=88874 RepID=A0ABW4RY26_9ACTN
METAERVKGGFELVLTEHDDKQAIYETWVALSTDSHGFHRYIISTGVCERLDKTKPTECDLSLATRIAGVINRAVEQTGQLPERITREYW